MKTVFRTKWAAPWDLNGESLDDSSNFDSGLGGWCSPLEKSYEFNCSTAKYQAGLLICKTLFLGYSNLFSVDSEGEEARAEGAANRGPSPSLIITIQVPSLYLSKNLMEKCVIGGFNHGVLWRDVLRFGLKGLVQGWWNYGSDDGCEG